MQLLFRKIHLLYVYFFSIYQLSLLRCLDYRNPWGRMPERFLKCHCFQIIIIPLFNPLNAELNPICYLLALLAQNFLHVSRIRVKSLTLRLLMAYIYIYIYIYIYMERIFLMFLDHTQRRSTVGRTPLDE